MSRVVESAIFGPASRFRYEKVVSEREHCPGAEYFFCDAEVVTQYSQFFVQTDDVVEARMWYDYLADPSDDPFWPSETFAGTVSVGQRGAW